VCQPTNTNDREPARDEGAGPKRARSKNATPDPIKRRVAGVPVELRFNLLGGYTLDHQSEPPEESTQVRAEVDARQLELTAKLRTSLIIDKVAARMGFVVEVPTGDEAFDRAFCVEAAPVDVALAVLNAEVRSAMLKLHVSKLEIGERGVQFEAQGWATEEARLSALFELAEKVALATSAAWRTLRAAASGYRLAPASKLRREQRQEIEALQAKRASRKKRAKAVWALVVAIDVAFLYYAFISK
jgi:hypothetical protein